jgi:hypothetical protein
MAATTPQLGLVTPTQGDLTGTWGNTVNNGITEYTDIAIAGTLTLTGDGAVTLANTLGDDSASNITSSLAGAGTVTAQFAIVKVSGTTTTKEVTGPSYSKTYVVDNASSFAVTFKASGQAGVSVAVGEKCTVYFNGTDYVKVASSVVDGVSTFSGGTTGLTPSTATSGAVTLAGTLAVANGGTNLTSFTANGVVYASSSSALTTGSALTFDGTKLGINTSSPVRTLSIANGGPVVEIDPAGGTAGPIYFNYNRSTATYLTPEYWALAHIWNVSGGIEAMRLTSTGLGIGTSSPGEKLDVVGGIRALTTSTSANTLRVGNTGNSTFLGVESSTGGVNIVGSTAYATTLTSNNPIQLSTNNGASVQATLDSAGNFGLGVTSPSQKLELAGVLRVKNGNADTNGLNLSSDAAGVSTINSGYAGAGQIVFQTEGTERMRLTSTGLGVGTTSPIGRLEAVGGTGAGFSGWFRTGDATAANNAGGGFYNTSSATAASRQAVMALDADGANLGGGDYFVIQKNGNNGTADILQYSNAAMRFGTNYTARAAYDMTLDSSGNLGLGVTPSAWVGYRAFQFGPTIADGAIASAGNDTNYATNCYFNSGWKYQSTGYAPVRYVQTSGVHQWYTAPSGNAGDPITFTQAMTLTADGNLGLGTTSPFSAANQTSLTINATTYPRLDFYSGGTQRAFINSGSTDTNIYTVGATPLTFGTNNTERARITSGGDLHLGLTVAAYNAERLTAYKSGNAEAAALVNDAGANNYTVAVSNRATTGDNKFMVFATEGSDTTRGSIVYNRAGGLTAYNTTSDYRAKDISGPLTDSGALIDSVPVYMGKMKGATQERPMFIAHEVPAYAHTGEKDAVDADGNPVYQQMDASALVPVMWAEIQSLRQRLAAAGI